MIRGMIMSEGKRLTWAEIQSKYPSQWVGIVDVDMKDSINIRSGVVKYTEKDMTSDEMALATIRGQMVARYTTPDDVCSVGALMA